MRLRSLWIGASAALGFSAAALAQNPPPASVYAGKVTPLGYVQCTSIGTATPITATGGVCSGGIPTGTAFADIIIEAQNIRYRTDGMAPTTTVGMLLAAGTDKTFSLVDMTKIQFIAVNPGAILDIEFFK